MSIEISDTARRHGIEDEDVLHAFRNAIQANWVEDVLMLIGADRGGRLLEVGAVDEAERCKIIHAMPARARHLR